MNLYRHFDENMVLLYIGISSNPFKRLDSHRKVSSWIADVRTITIEPIATSGPRDMTAAFEAERVAIEKEKPLHNINRHRPGKQQIRIEMLELREKDRKQWTWAAIAKKYGISPQRAQQIGSK